MHGCGKETGSDHIAAYMLFRDITRLCSSNVHYTFRRLAYSVKFNVIIKKRCRLITQQYLVELRRGKLLKFINLLNFNY